MTIPKRYPFNGEQMTIPQIRALYPRYSDRTLRVAVIDEKCASLADLQERDRRGQANIKAANRENAKRMPKLCATKSEHRRQTYRHDLNSMGLRS